MTQPQVTLAPNFSKKGILNKQKSKLLTASNVTTKHIEPINTDNDFYENSLTPGKTRSRNEKLVT